MVKPSQLKTASTAAYGESDPIKRLEFEVERIADRSERIESSQTDIEARVNALQVKGVVNHYEDDFIAVNGSDQPETVDLSWKLNGQHFYSNGEQVDLLRPSDGVTDEFLGTIIDDGFAIPEASVFETFCEFDVSPTVTRIRPSDGSTATLVLGVDYTEDLNNGTITIIPAGTNIAIDDQLFLTATFDGEWAISLVGDEEGNLFFLRGFTNDPKRHWFEIYGNRTDVALISVIRDVSDVSVFTAADVDFLGNEYVYDIATNRFFDFAKGHTHTGQPNDAPKLLFNESIEIYRAELGEDMDAKTTVYLDATDEKAYKITALTEHGRQFAGIVDEGGLAGETAPIVTSGIVKEIPFSNLAGSAPINERVWVAESTPTVTNEFLGTGDKRIIEVGHRIAESAIYLEAVVNDVDIDPAIPPVNRALSIDEVSGAWELVELQGLAVNLNFESDNTQSSTTSTTYQEKLKLTTTDLPLGDYFVFFSCEIANSNNDKPTFIRLHLNDTDVIQEPQIRRSRFPDEWGIASGATVQENLSGINEVDLDWKADTGATNTAYIRRATIILWRVA